MKTTILKGCLLACTFLIANPGWAIAISLEPASTIAAPGDTVFLDLTISGLGSGAAPSLGGYDINILFDDVALDFLGATFGGDLNDPFDPFTPFVQGLIAGTGTVNLAEVSLLTVAALDAGQPDSFVLATLSFFVDVLPLGSTTIVDFGSFLLSDGVGVELVDVSSSEAVIRNPSGVPEPVTLLLFGIGLLGLGAARRNG